MFLWHQIKYARVVRVVIECGPIEGHIPVHAEPIGVVKTFGLCVYLSGLEEFVDVFVLKRYFQYPWVFLAVENVV